MFSDIKRLFSHVSVYGLSNIIERSLSFVLLPIHTNYILEGDYGIVAQVFGSIAFLAVLYQYGLDAAFFRFYLMKEPGFTRKNVFSTVVYTIICTSVFFSFVLFLFSDNLADFFLDDVSLSFVIKWMIGVLFLDTLLVFPFLLLRAEERSLLFAGMKIGKVLITLVLNVIFIIYMKKGFEYIFVAMFFASASTLVLMVPIILKQLSFEYSGQVIRELLKFGLPYIIPYLSVISMDVIDRFFLGRMLGNEITGIYSAGYRLAMAMNLYVSAFRFAWHPFFLSIADKEDVRKIYARILTYFLLIGGWIYLGICYFINDIITIPLFGSGNLLGPAYWEGAKIVPLVMPAYLFYGIYVNFIVGIYIKKQSKHLPYVTGISALTNIGLNYLLIPVYGMWGAAIATLAAYALMAVLLYFVTQRFYPVSYEFGRLARLIIVTTLLFVIPYIIPITFLREVKFLLLLSFPLIFLATGFFDKDEIAALKRLFSRLK